MNPYTMKTDNLRIEFRAVPYGHEGRILEYRISPDQDLTYHTSESCLFGLVKFKRKRKHDTGWKMVQEFRCGITGHYYSLDHWINHMPIWCEDQETLNWYKRTFETVGAFKKYIAEREKGEYEKYWTNREKYIDSRKKILY